jgi:hypothetical protein
MGGQPWPSSRSINDGMASSRERKGREGERSRGEEDTAWGRHGEGRATGGAMGRACGLLVAISLFSVRAECEEKAAGGKEKKRRRKERRKRKGRKRKERKRKTEKFPNLKISKK